MTAVVHTAELSEGGTLRHRCAGVGSKTVLALQQSPARQALPALPHTRSRWYIYPSCSTSRAVFAASEEPAPLGEPTASSSTPPLRRSHPRVCTSMHVRYPGHLEQKTGPHRSTGGRHVGNGQRAAFREHAGCNSNSNSRRELRGSRGCCSSVPAPPHATPADGPQKPGRDLLPQLTATGPVRQQGLSGWRFLLEALGAGSRWVVCLSLLSFVVVVSSHVPFAVSLFFSRASFDCR